MAASSGSVYASPAPKVTASAGRGEQGYSRDGDAYAGSLQTQGTLLRGQGTVEAGESLAQAKLPVTASS